MTGRKARGVGAPIAALLRGLPVLVMLLPLTSCRSGGRVAELEVEVSRLDQERTRLLEVISGLEKQIEVLQGTAAHRAELGSKTITKLFRVDRVELAAPSAGHDFDGAFGDDGLMLYLKLYDEAGDVIKAAGDIQVDIYELANPPKRLGHCEFSVEQAEELWYGRLLTYHYRLPCQWEQAPSERTVTARVTYLDYLTGRVFQATKQIETTPPTPAARRTDNPAGQPE